MHFFALFSGVKTFESSKKQKEEHFGKNQTLDHHHQVSYKQFRIPETPEDWSKKRARPFDREHKKKLKHELGFARFSY